MLVRFAWLGLTAVVTPLVIASVASAQAWAADRARAQGRGIRLGDFELHPGIGAEAGYNSNMFLSDPGEEVESAVLRISPHLYLSTLSGERLQGEVPKLAFRAGLSGALLYFFAPGEGDVGVGQDARFTWTPSPIFAVELFNDFRRTIDPFTDPASPTTAGTGGQLQYGRDRLVAGSRLQLSTTGGLLKGGIGYRFDWDHFESALFDPNSNYAHSATADTSWEFLPMTALFWNGAVQRHDFDQDNAPRAIGVRNSSTRVQSKIGLNGALTQRVGFTIAGGYSAGFFADDNDYDGVIAQVEARWRLRETMLWALGYDRDFITAFQGNFARMDRLHTRLQTLFGGSVLLGLRAELTFVNFGFDARLADPASEVTGDPERSDIHLLTNLNGEYRLTDWLAITAEVGYVQNFSDAVYIFMASGPGADSTDEARFKRFQAWLGVRAFL
jgi:hypothetical protein